MSLLSHISLLAHRAAAASRVLLLHLACASAFALVPGATAATPAVSDEYDIKAVFLLKFAHFVAWPAPASPEQPLVIGVLGKDPFGGRLDQAVRNEKVEGRSLVVKRIQQLDDVGNCDLLFISKSEKLNLGKILDRLRGHAVFTVSDIPEFAEMGGMIGLVTDTDKIRLHINVGASKKAANFTISANLLRVAQIVNTPSSQFGPPGRLQQFAAEIRFLFRGGS
jgi:hypothetical protein